MQIFEYLDTAGDSPYRDWFESLDAQAAAKVTVALTRIGLGNLSNVKLELGYRNLGSISDQDIESTSEGTAIGW